MVDKKRFFFIALAILLLDQFTKMLVRSVLAVGDSVPLIPSVLHLTYVSNAGAAFGILQSQRLIFIAVSLFVLGYLWKAWKTFDKTFTWPLGLLVGGLFGNLIDRIFFGRVTDFIDFRVWPVFNVADSAITISAVWLAVLLWHQDTDKRVKGK